MFNLDQVSEIIFDSVQDVCNNGEQSFELFLEKCIEKKEKISSISEKSKEEIKTIFLTYRKSRTNLEKHASEIQGKLNSVLIEIETDMNFTRGLTCDYSNKDGFNKLLNKIVRVQ